MKIRTQYVAVRDDNGEKVGIGPTKNLDSVENDKYDWDRDGIPVTIMKRTVVYGPWGAV